MNYSFKVTTAGRELLATLLATGQVLELTRVAVGCGRVAEDANLADMTDLIQYVAEGTLTQRRHEDNILYLTVQYASNSTPGLAAFYLSEFIVQARHPDTGENVTFLYATLGDYIQHVNAYSEELPPDIRNYPMMIAITDEIEVSITAPAGLITYDELEQACENLRNTLVSRTLLWENASPNSVFVEQTIAVNAGDYDEIEIAYLTTSGGTDNRHLTACFVYDLVYGYIQFMQGTHTEPQIYYRRISMSATAIEITSCNDGDASDGNIIPVRIYGIKGVQ